MLLRGALRDNTCFSLSISLAAARSPCPLLRAFLRFLPCFSSSLPSIVRVRRDATFRDATPILYLLSVSLSLFLSFYLPLRLRSFSPSPLSIFPLLSSLSRTPFIAAYCSASALYFPRAISRLRSPPDGSPRGLLPACTLQGKGISSEKGIPCIFRTRSRYSLLLRSPQRTSVSRLMLLCRKATLDVHRSLFLSLSLTPFLSAPRSTGRLCLPRRSSTP